MRVTHTMLLRSSLSDLNQIADESERLLRQAGSGRRYARASEDTVGATRALRLRSEISGDNSLIESLRTGTEDLTQAELTIDDGISVLQRAKELAIQGASSAHADADFEAIASEAEQLFFNMASLANRQNGKRYLFSGTESFTQPFQITGDPPTGVTYQGNSDSRVVRPSSGVTFETNLPGDEVFQGPVDVFAALLQLRDAARAHDVEALSGSVAAAIEGGLDQLIDVRTEVGTVQAGLERTVNLLTQAVLQNEESLSETEDADMVEVLTKLQVITNRQQAALQAAARMIQPSLMDYLA